MQPRYFNEDGSVNWKFIERMQLGFVRDKSEAEHEVMVAYALGGKAAVLKLLARRDVLVIDRDLWWQESYQQFLFAKMGRVVAEPEDFAVGRPLCHIVGEGVVCP